ncbi:MAG: OmpA family protein [Gemmatimonadetes bacterium]|nr:OmpA family protein [Gemmatimonadota bacterium]
MSAAKKGKESRPIIVVRKKAHHGGHHGGSWKVAYADFVTAMMAFFLVMWILGMDSHTKDLIQGYFTNPVGFKKAYSSGENPLSMGNSPSNLDVRRIALLARDFQRVRFEQVREQIRRRLSDDAELRALAGQVEIVITREGLRIELLEAGEGNTFFATGSATVTPAAERLLVTIAESIADLPNPIVIEGHTDARPYGSGAYTNWELSADRANAARRVLTAGGVDPERVTEVRGYADRDLRLPHAPLAAANRRVSILLPFQEPKLLQNYHPGDPLSIPRAGN